LHLLSGDMDRVGWKEVEAEPVTCHSLLKLMSFSSDERNGYSLIRCVYQFVFIASGAQHLQITMRTMRSDSHMMHYVNSGKKTRTMKMMMKRKVTKRARTTWMRDQCMDGLSWRKGREARAMLLMGETDEMSLITARCSPMWTIEKLIKRI
jgi:hypothetical protein